MGTEGGRLLRGHGGEKDEGVVELEERRYKPGVISLRSGTTYRGRIIDLDKSLIFFCPHVHHNKVFAESCALVKSKELNHEM